MGYNESTYCKINRDKKLIKKLNTRFCSIKRAENVRNSFKNYVTAQMLFYISM